MTRKREPIVIKISGSFIQPDKPEYVKGYAEVLQKLYEEENYRPFVVVGGGKIARMYINTARTLGASESMLDLLGIDVTRLNAHLLITALRDKALSYPPSTVDELLIAKQDPLERIVVMGGLQPGQSTNAVSAVVAEIVGAKLIINATKVEGVFDSDPCKNKYAKLIKKLTVKDLERILQTQSSQAGRYELLDQPSLTIIQRSRITLRVINGHDPMNIVRVLRGEDIGTIVTPY